jgi:hypothetical protein
MTAIMEPASLSINCSHQQGICRHLQAASIIPHAGAASNNVECKQVGS